MKPYAVWVDKEFGFCYGRTIEADGKKIIGYYDTYDEARIFWKWYYYNP